MGCSWVISFSLSILHFRVNQVEFENAISRNSSVNLNTSLPKALLSANTIDLSSKEFLLIFVGLSFVLLMLSLTRSLWFRSVLVQSASRLHNAMFTAIIQSPLQFFNRNPVGRCQGCKQLQMCLNEFSSAGRILNRFSKDMNATDELLPFSFQEFVQVAFLTLLPCFYTF